MKSIELEKNGGVEQETYDHPDHIGESDWRITIYSMPTGYLAAATNGDPVYEENPEEWGKLVEEYNL